jgi:hypothetical protein
LSRRGIEICTSWVIESKDSRKKQERRCLAVRTSDMQAPGVMQFTSTVGLFDPCSSSTEANSRTANTSRSLDTAYLYQGIRISLYTQHHKVSDVEYSVTYLSPPNLAVLSTFSASKEDLMRRQKCEFGRCISQPFLSAWARSTMLEERY